MPKIASTQNIAISNETHKLLVSYIEKIDGKLGKYADRAIKEKLEKDTKQFKLPS